MIVLAGEWDPFDVAASRCKVFALRLGRLWPIAALLELARDEPMELW